MRFTLMRFVLLLVSGTVCLTSHSADIAIPDDLKSWQGWALHGEEFRRCPFFANRQPRTESEFVCAWPERLTLNVNARGGDFTQRWQVFADSWISLPGDNEHWPRTVRMNGVAAPVITHNGIPSLRLTSGNYTVTGSLQWSTRPEQLAIPPQTGIVELSVDGHAIAQPERPDGAVWLGRRRSAEQQQQTSMQIYRLVKDDVPAMLTTQIRLQVSGEAREELLGRALPNGFTPMSITSALPARIESDGGLRVQLRPGQWVIAIEARGAGVASELTAPIASDTGEEVWSYQANDRLRVTAVEGVNVIDAAQANVPNEWNRLPAYRMNRGAVFKIIERSRGLENQDANQLQLQRQLWLDFNHDGYTVVDNVTGSMRREWRLDMAKPFSVMSARLSDAAGGGNLLITTGAQQDLTGVEVRSSNLNLQTVARLSQASGRLPATGWQTRFASVSGQLNLPPGHHLVSALGDVDAPTSWTASWQLLDFFIVLIVAVGAWKLRSVSFGALTLVTLVLVHQEQSTFAWLLVNVLIAVALVNVAPMGRLKTAMAWYRAVSLIAIVLMFLPFALSQVRLGLYPQMEFAYGSGFADESRRYLAADAPQSKLDLAEIAPPAAVAIETKEQAVDAMKSNARRKVFSSASAQVSVSQRYAPGTVVQAGPGIPTWSFRSYPYSWSGPVDIGETVRFVIATPLWMFAWRVLGVLLLGSVIVVIAQMSFRVERGAEIMRPFMRKPTPSVNTMAFVVLALLVAVAPQNLQAAATPDQQVLNELKVRLTQPPVCAPNCSEALAAQIALTAEKLEMTLDVSALSNVAVTIPVAVGRWEPESVTVDGQSAGALYRDAQRNYWVALKSGAHTIRISGRLAAAESIQLVFPQKPRAIVVSGSGWEVSGVSDGRLLTNALELVRQRSSANNDRLAAPTEFAPFVRVQRVLQFDLDWSVTTIVERIAPDKGAFTVEIPLLKNESVLTQGITIREKGGDRTALVGLTAGENQVSWNSALPRAESLELSMATGAERALDRTEFWSFAVSPIWNVQFAGVPQVAPLSGGNQMWTFDYYPRANETLKLLIYRPEGVVGQTLAIDNVHLMSNVGKRFTDTSLQMSYRSTQGGRHTIVLPKDSQVMSVTADGVPVPVRPQEGELALSLLPGAHQLAVQWQSDAGARWHTQSTQIDLRNPASNITTSIVLGDERWVLFVRGQGVGPVILYWGELLVFVVLAVLLGRYTESPLRMHDWLLLGLGLSTFSWSVLFVFAVWIFAMRWRSTAPELSRVQFNLRQIALGLLSVIAIGSLVSAIPSGLLRQPDMSVRSPSGGFSWFMDQAASTLPQPAAFSVPLIVYKIAILLWALWLSFALIRWLPWAWRAYSNDGIWRGAVARSA